MPWRIPTLHNTGEGSPTFEACCYDQEMPYQTIYSSESATPMQASDLEEILLQARNNNRKNRITGALVYVDGVFLQVLEGDANVVLGLMDKISRDVRHETVTVLRAEEVSNAQFGDWDMAYVSATAEEVAKWAGLSFTQSVPDILTDLRNNPASAKRVAQSILAVLARR